MEQFISEEVEHIAKKIRRYKEEYQLTKVEPSRLVALFPSEQEQSIILSTHEVAYILSEIAGRPINIDYVKRLRLATRLPITKQVSKRAFIFVLHDVLRVTFRKTYVRKPPGRPKTTTKNLSDRI